MRGLKNILLILALALLAGCKGNKARQELLKWRVSLKMDDKQPYGTYLAHESLKYYFPGVMVQPLPNGLSSENMATGMSHTSDERYLVILQGLDFYVSAAEWTALKEFIARGNEVIIFSRILDSKIEEELGYYKSNIGDEESPLMLHEQARNEDVLSIAATPQKKYGYEGRTIRGYFGQLAKAAPENGKQEEKTDTATADDQDDEAEDSAIIHADTLGYAGEKVNFIRFGLGKGHLTLHAAPLALSNYFLLQPGNYEYLTSIWQTLPHNINRIFWHEYYKRSVDTSLLGVLMRYPATRLAFFIALLALVAYILFEGKRKQRIIPVTAPLKNDSVSFVETVGRLYYNKGNHSNLAAKMTQQFLEWVRTRYMLNTNHLNEQFTQQLILKSGKEPAVVHELMRMIHEVRSGSATIDDPYLYQLYTAIQQFYRTNIS